MKFKQDSRPCQSNIWLVQQVLSKLLIMESHSCLDLVLYEKDFEKIMFKKCQQWTGI